MIRGARALRLLALGFAALLVAGCATTTSRPVNPPLAKADSRGGYRFETRPATNLGDTIVILAFSGGGTRAAAFSYGVLEELRRTPLVVHGKPSRMLDQVDVITGVSGGSFTALAYGLYGERLFDVYERQFLKHNVQGDLVARFLNPYYWPALMSGTWGRSEMAASLYDDLLFHGATFGDLAKKPGPLILATATDISTGSRLGFVQGEFDLICSDVSAVPLSRAAAASSAVPMVLSPVTFNNYGGHCGYRYPQWAAAISDPANPSRPAGRALQRLNEMRSFEDSADRPYLHLVDGGLSDNLGMRAVLESLEEIEASPRTRQASAIRDVKRIVVFVVNSLSVPDTDWDHHERPPNDIQILLKATGVPIDRYSYEAVELLKDIIFRWKELRALRASGLIAGANNPGLARATDVPDIDLFAVDVSIAADEDKAEREYLNNLPTSFVLPDEAVDRLRAAAARILRTSPEYQRLLRDLGGTAPAQ
ncbi:MAG TPA: patatin-like phospholipase family protein [Casimicrobiaceae bacterium]|nr:patatin-like phospholipase family protein [Casimicrobiaceae bacterium]